MINAIQQFDILHRKSLVLLEAFLVSRKKKSFFFFFCKGGKEYLMRAHFGLPSVEAEDKEGKPPISVKFEIPYFTTSGIQVGS